MSKSRSSSIVLSNVYKEYKTKNSTKIIALNHVNAVFNIGMYLIKGPNGSGKSTLLRVIAGITKPRRGEITIFGKKLWRECNDECITILRRRLIGYVPQTLLLSPFMKVSDTIAFPLLLENIEDWDKRVTNIAEVLGISNLLGRKVRELSIGQRQLIAIARAFIINPKIILLDEPFSHLDKEVMNNVASILMSWKNEKVVIITNTEETSKIEFDEVYCMSKGELFQCKD